MFILSILILPILILPVSTGRLKYPLQGGQAKPETYNATSFNWWFFTDWECSPTPEGKKR
jgi:hypothetical protein